MTLVNVLQKAATLLGLNIDVQQTGTEQTLLINCALSTICRVSGEFTDVKHKEKLVSESNFIPYSSFSKTVKRVLGIKLNGEKRSFFEESGGIKVPEDGEYEVVYAYISDGTTMLNTIDLPPRFNERILALGTAGEYCYGKGYYKEGEIYDERFVAALSNVERETRSLTVGSV